MTEPLNKHSRMPRKATAESAAELPAPPKDNVIPAAKLEKASPRAVLKRLLSDESPEQIAASYGVTTHALNLFLMSKSEQGWKDTQMARAASLKNEAETMMRNAKEPLSLAKGRELMKAAQWDLERVGRRIYGQEMNVSIRAGLPDLGDKLRRRREEIEEFYRQQREKQAMEATTVAVVESPKA